MASYRSINVEVRLPFENTAMGGSGRRPSGRKARWARESQNEGRGNGQLGFSKNRKRKEKNERTNDRETQGQQLAVMQQRCSSGAAQISELADAIAGVHLE